MTALGIVERDELRAAIVAGERSAAAIASEFGITERSVVRRRSYLRSIGVPVRLSEDLGGVGGGKPPMNQPAIAIDMDAAREEAERLGPLAPTDMFRCEFFRCALMVRACLERQAKKPTRSDSKYARVGGQCDRFAHCNAGTCAQGAVIKLRVRGWRPAPSAQEQAYARRIAEAPRALAEIEQRIADNAAAVEQSEGADLAARAEAEERGEFEQWLKGGKPSCRTNSYAGSSRSESASRTRPFNASSTSPTSSAESSSSDSPAPSVPAAAAVASTSNSARSGAASSAAAVAPVSTPAKEQSMRPIDSITDDEVRQAFKQHCSAKKLRDHFGGAYATWRARCNALGLRTRITKDKGLVADTEPPPRVGRRRLRGSCCRAAPARGRTPARPAGANRKGTRRPAA